MSPILTRFLLNWRELVNTITRGGSNTFKLYLYFERHHYLDTFNPFVIYTSLLQACDVKDDSRLPPMIPCLMHIRQQCFFLVLLFLINPYNLPSVNRVICIIMFISSQSVRCLKVFYHIISDYVFDDMCNVKKLHLLA